MTNFKFEEILKSNPNGVLATRDGENIKTRIFQYLFSDGNKVYFCTSSEKSVYKQLKKNPNISFCTHPQNFTPVISINGKAVFTENNTLKKRALDENPPIKNIYHSHENPIFKLFYIDAKEVETYSFAEGPKNYKL